MLHQRYPMSVLTNKKKITIFKSDIFYAYILDTYTDKKLYSLNAL